ncbi:type IV pilin protein [Alkanindiges illinoisensis]|uniref:Type IV pilin protein n=2 Tax=Alkanindiges illinoisensis TaxID=197183 RepID=A0A4Y7XFI5_9GAMM|nr:type IV pilin protein [Alkanindiges illinoisensis]
MNRVAFGFTLIEVMIVVAIIGVISAIAYPSYKQHVIRGKRLDAQSEMLQIAQMMESYKLRKGTFANATVNDIYGSTETPKQGTALYGLAFTPSPTTANSWTLVATPKNGQTNDGALILTDTGAQCWYKGADVPRLTTTTNPDGSPRLPDTCYKWTDR